MMMTMMTWWPMAASHMSAQAVGGIGEHEAPERAARDPYASLGFRETDAYYPNPVKGVR